MQSLFPFWVHTCYETEMTTQTITETFETEQDFVDMMFECGAKQNEMDRIVADGFVTAKELVIHHENDTETFRDYLKLLNKTFNQHPDPALKLYFPPPVISRLVGVLFYCKVCYYNFHVIPDIRKITKGMASDFYKLYEDLKNVDDSEQKNDTKAEIPSLKGASNWRSFRDLVTMRLSFLVGKSGFPVEYVIDKTERKYSSARTARGEEMIVDLEMEDVFKSHPVHFGKSFKEDNKRVWNVLKSLLLESPAYDHILSCDRTSDGRKAWHILQDFYEGEDFKQRLQDEAFVLLNKSMYKGNSNRHNFESYVNRHIKAHKLLLEAGYNGGKGMDNSTKIQHIKGGIRLEAGLEHAITSARTMGLLRGTFQSFVSFLSAEVDQKEARKRELQTNVKVSSINTNNSKRKFNDRNQQGQGNNKQIKYSETVDGKKVESKKYSPEEWKSLTPSQRSAVIRLNRKRRAAVKNQRNDVSIKSLGGSLSKESLSTISEAIVASITKQSQSNEKQKIKEESNDENASESRATAGQVGRFLARARN